MMKTKVKQTDSPLIRLSAIAKASYDAIEAKIKSDVNKIVLEQKKKKVAGQTIYKFNQEGKAERDLVVKTTIVTTKTQNGSVVKTTIVTTKTQNGFVVKSTVVSTKY